MHKSLIILAAGMSSRMKNSEPVKGIDDNDITAANQRSKGLISVGNKNRPLLDYILFNAREAGYQDIYLVTRKENQHFQQLYGENTRENYFHGLKIFYAIQHIPVRRQKPFGTADAVYQTLVQYPKLQNEAFTVCNSDNLYSLTAFRLLRETNAPNAWIAYDRAALDFPAERISRFAAARSDAQNYLLEMVEKPRTASIESYRDNIGAIRVSMNIFKFSGPLFYPFLENCPVNPERNEKELATAIMDMLRAHPRTMLGLPLAEHVPDLTEKRDILKMREYLEKNITHPDWS